MKAKTAMGGFLYLICAILSGGSFLLESEMGTYSTVAFMGGIFALVWIMAALWAFRELGNVYYTSYDTDVESHYDYDIIIVTASRRVANQSSIGFLAGIGVLSVVLFLEGFSGISAMLGNQIVMMNLIAGALSIMASMILRSVVRSTN